MEVTLYSMNCPKCKVLEEKLTEKGVGFSICTDVAEMKKLGIMAVPKLMVDGELFDFSEGVKWINEYKC